MFFRVIQRAILRTKSSTIKLGNMGSIGKKETILSPFVWVLVRIFGYKSLMACFQKLHESLAKGDPFASLFKTISPDLVVVSRIVNYSADYGVMKSAVARGIPLISLVSSWDNFTSKGYLTFSSRITVVWNNMMKNKARQLFNIPEKKILVAGIPRFDCYDTYLKLDSEQILKRRQIYMISIGNIQNWPIISYCTGTRNWCKNNYTQESPEADLVSSIYLALSKHLRTKFFFVVRIHPGADKEPYETLVPFPNVAVESPGESSGYQDRVLELTEEFGLADTVYFSSVVLNYASTISIDCAALDIPFICVNYTKEEIPFKYSPKRLYLFDHYAELIDMSGIALCDSENQLVESVERLLEGDDSKYLSINKKIRDQFIQFNDGNSGARVGQVIDHMLHELDRA